MDTNYYAVIMAGGIGTRFWPASRKDFPKQFQDILGSGQTLIQKTFSRLANSIPAENILVLTNSLYEELVKKQLPEISPQQIICEPEMKNTAPCILLSALKIQKKNPDALMVVAPSDHWIENEAAFAENLQIAFDACQRNNFLMTLGIQPTFPNTGYGYIKYEKQPKSPVKKALAFTEKPDYNTAKTFLEQGTYLWNAGIFTWKAARIVQAFQKHLPEMYSLFSKGIPALNTSAEKEFITKNYAQSEAISIDYGIMEKAENVYVLPATFDWSDLGTWGALYEKTKQNNQENVVVNAQTIFENASGNLVHTSTKKIVAIDGLKDYIVVDTKDALLIIPKSKEQEVKKMREKAGKLNPNAD